MESSSQLPQGQLSPDKQSFWSGSQWLPIPVAPPPPDFASKATTALGNTTLLGLGVAFLGFVYGLAAFLPWVHVSGPFIGNISKSGWEGGDGKITAFLGLILVVLGILLVRVVSRSAPLAMAAVVTSVAALGIMVYEFVHVGQAAQAMTDAANSSGNPFATAIAQSLSVGPDLGLFVSIIAAAAALAGSLVLVMQLRKPATVVFSWDAPDPA